MSERQIAPLKLHAQIERWPLLAPFRIAGYTFHHIDVLLIALEHEGAVGRGEAAGVYYKKDSPETMLAQLQTLRSTIEAGINRDALPTLLPPGGLRNALDCALWDLQAQREQRSVWSIAGLTKPKPLITTFTCGAGEPHLMVQTARAYANARALKLKLTGEPIDADRIHAMREAFPGTWIGVDANQGFTLSSLEQLMPVLIQARIALIEQPFAVGEEALLERVESPIPIAADESVQCLADMQRFASLFDVVNIKLDKCGGLTEGLEMARRARECGLEPMVGNMIGTSLAIAPAFVVGQLCEVVDLDGPVFLKSDRAPRVIYEEGLIQVPSGLWGGSSDI
jgi:L-alanine-DL-glutamate epimerase-like enolase superfamily enzyme